MEIYNLATYIIIFSGCAVNLINYENIEISSDISTPIWVTRFKAVKLCGISLTGYDRFPLRFHLIILQGFQKTNGPKCFNGKPKISMLSNVNQQRGWNCLTRFYIHPSTKYYGIVPATMYEEKFVGHPPEFSPRVGYDRPGYHVLVQDTDSNSEPWKDQMSKILFENSQLFMMMIIVQEKIISHLELHFRHCCSYNFGTDVPDLTRIIGEINHFSRVDMGLCVITSIKWPPMYKNIRFSEILKDNITLDAVYLNLVAGPNTSLEFAYPHCTGNPSGTLAASSTVITEHPKCNFWLVNTPTISTMARSAIQVTKGSESFSFLTCSPPSYPKTSLEKLATVFTPDLWAWIGGTSILLAAFLCVTSSGHISIVDALTTSYSILLEQSNPHAVNQGKKNFLYFLCAAWILTALVITNLIRGDNVTNTVSPLSVVPYENFSQLFANNFILSDREVILGCPEFFKTCLETIAFAYDAAYSIAESDFGSMINRAMYERIEKSVTNNRIPFKQNYWLHYSRNKSEFSCVGHKVAILGWLEQLQEAKDYLEREKPGPEYGLGKEPMVSVKFGWATRNILDPRITMRIKALDFSNIADKWVWYAERAIILQRRNKNNHNVATGPTPLALHGNISEIFKALLAAILISLRIFAIEYITNVVVTADWQKLQQRLVLGFTKSMFSCSGPNYFGRKRYPRKFLSRKK
ncbi:hypothetical protein Fcan01_21935 [Folsomia candida]|uniref:Uncharacterized protein n=1 Tax=Folsomia candida TaxID=158441 RepID=A0A226DD74_FOLCA|nr:hypothetical protein Fcan01_21935 [Folsomia candida]